MSKKYKTKEEWKTWGGVFDNFTRRTLFELSSKGHFLDIESPIKVGKESQVFSAIKEDNTRVALKIYRLETADFNRMYEYIAGDKRFIGLKKQRRKIIFAWVQREYRNLLKFREAGIRVPLPITFSNNVLVEEFIGGDRAAPQLKDAVPKNIQKFWKDLFSQLQMLAKHDLVHGDLSAFNILNDKEKPVIIDLSTSTTKDHPNYKMYWQRDLKNVAFFFNKHGLELNHNNLYKQLFSKTSSS